jgi:hypothetical protein
MTPDDSTAAAALFTLGCILTGYALVTAARWAVEAHRAGMRRLAIHRARQTCVHLDSWRSHTRSVRGER